MARIVVEGPINGATRKRVLKALKEVADREFPALLLRIDSPGARSVTARKFTPPFFACVKRVSGCCQLRQHFSFGWGLHRRSR